MDGKGPGSFGIGGSGEAAAEEAMFLTKFASKVTIIAREPEFTCAKSIADKVKEIGRASCRERVSSPV